MTIPQTLEIALQHHQSGRLAEAEALYRQILAVQPQHADAIRFLGVIARQVGRHDMAAKLIHQAIAIDPNNPFAHHDLGEACWAAGRLDEAAAAFRRAIELKWDFPAAHNNLGGSLAAQGRFAEAIVAFRRAIELKPDWVEAQNNLGAALAEQGQLNDAIMAFRRALELDSKSVEAHSNLGSALARRGQLDEAVAVFRRALQIKPNFPEVYSNLGNALRDQGQLDEAIAACRRAIELKADYAEAHNNLGNALSDRGQRDEAVAAFGRAIELRPDFAQAWNNLGAALAEQWRSDEAIAAYRRALELQPDHVEACNNLGAALKDQGDLDEAIAAFRRALQVNPKQAKVHSNLIYTLHFHPAHDPKSISSEQERWNRQFSEPLKQFIRPQTNDPGLGRRLRIGYVSSEFCDHVVGRNLLPLFEYHDRERFEIYCYCGVARPDRFTEEFRRHTDEWRSTVGAGDEALARIIRQDEVDILVDLSQHMSGNRLPVFARKPAPIQVSFAGYPETTGLDTIEYRISDPYLEGASSHDETGRAERVHAIESFWSYAPRGVEVAVNGLPALKNGSITFGCLNNFCKVNEPMLRVWARALCQTPGSRLILMAHAGSGRKRALDILGREGVEADRVEFQEYYPRRKYLESYHRLDIVLDTFPYNGHTTSLDALWMGVPVVSLAGTTPLSRGGLSQLTNLGLPELVAHSEVEFADIAARLAGDLPRLAELRATLRQQMQASPLMDAAGFAANVEGAFQSMWESWCVRKVEA